MLNGQQLLLLRLRLDVTQNSVSKIYGCSRNYISMLENNKESFVTEEKYKKYIDALYAAQKQKKQELENKKEIDNN